MHPTRPDLPILRQFSFRPEPFPEGAALGHKEAPGPPTLTEKQPGMLLFLVDPVPPNSKFNHSKESMSRLLTGTGIVLLMGSTFALAAGRVSHPHGPDLDDAQSPLVLCHQFSSSHCLLDHERAEAHPASPARLGYPDARHAEFSSVMNQTMRFCCVCQSKEARSKTNQRTA